MSRSSGMVKFKDDTILYCIYNNTTDIMHDKLFDKLHDAYDNWYNYISFDNQCNCEGENVFIYSDYAGGKIYTGKACKEHKCILFDFNNYLECNDNNEMWWRYKRYSNEQIEQEKLKHEQILGSNWLKWLDHEKYRQILKNNWMKNDIQF